MQICELVGGLLERIGIDSDKTFLEDNPKDKIKESYENLLDSVNKYIFPQNFIDNIEGFKKIFRQDLRETGTNDDIVGSIILNADIYLQKYTNQNHPSKLIKTYKKCELLLASYIVNQEEIDVKLSEMRLIELRNFIDNEFQTNPKKYDWIFSLREKVIKEFENKFPKGLLEMY